KTRRGRRRLARSLERVRSAADVRRMHSARISAKRLRYLLEPFAQELPRARRGVEALKDLQSLVGRMRDSRGLRAALSGRGDPAAAALSRALEDGERRLFA